MEPSNRNQETAARDLHHLFSVILTAALLVYLYLPRTLLPLLICPSFISSVLFIFSLFQFVPSQPESKAPPEKDRSCDCHDYTKGKDVTPVETCWSVISHDHDHRRDCFDFGRPLDVIYEEYEGEETESENSMLQERDDSETSKEDDEIERWLKYAMWLSEDKDKNQETEEDELIEFPFGEEEDNLIELDLSRYHVEDIKQEKVVGFLNLFD